MNQETKDEYKDCGLFLLMIPVIIIALIYKTLECIVVDTIPAMCGVILVGLICVVPMATIYGIGWLISKIACLILGES